MQSAPSSAADEAPAASKAEAEVDSENSSIDALSGSQQVAIDELSAALASSDCDGAARYRDAVCDLSKKICELERQLPTSTRGSSRCADGEQRCERARQRLAESCER
jgi:hypothetical protein